MHCALCKSLKTLNNTVYVYTNLEDVNDPFALHGLLSDSDADMVHLDPDPYRFLNFSG